MEAALESGFAQASIQVLLEKLSSFAMNEINLIMDVDSELRKLQRTLLRIQAMLDLAEISHVQNVSMCSAKAWQMWVEDVKKLSYDADDLIDDILVDLSRYNGGSINGAVEGNNLEVRTMLLSSFRLRVPREIGRIQQQLENLAGEMDNVFTGEFARIEAAKTFKRDCFKNGSSFSMIDADFMVGRERETMEFIEMLLDGDFGRPLSSNYPCVIPITGMAGIGKTMLARVVYNSAQVTENFDLRMWVSVSIEFDIVKVTKSMIECASEKNCRLSHLDAIQAQLAKLLKRKKFLLVLDDFWSEEHEDWEILCSTFKVGSRGRKIIITTRSATVSYIAGTVPPYYLPTLSDTECWEIVKQRAFLRKSLEEKRNLENIGRDIAKKCKGLPLAAKTVGSMLYSKSKFLEWDSVLKSELWELPQGKNGIFPALTLSYHYLPAHLKKCFAYCSIFPYNHKFEANTLVLLWIAEGFIQPVGERRLEDIGDDYFKELSWRSFFYYSHIDANNKVIYKMHDFMQIMGRLVSADICFQMKVDCSPPKKYVRHMSKCHVASNMISLRELTACQRLRTFIFICEAGARIGNEIFFLFQRFRLLRVLDLSRGGITDLSDSIDQLKCLRYLDLSENHVHNLPESMGNLICLQTLRLRNCIRLRQLPSSMSKLTSLRHLFFDIKRQLDCMPSGLGQLINLQTLHAFIVGDHQGCGIRELRDLKFLRNSLCITNLENVSSLPEANQAMLLMKPWLNKLEFEWNASGDSIRHQEVLSGLQPNENLKELVISGYCGQMFPSWLGNPWSCKLTTIHLRSCRDCAILPPLGQLVFLKNLIIEGLSSLVFIDKEFCGSDGAVGFPSLESLTFRNMPMLIEWKELTIHKMPCLLELTFEDCPLLVRLPSFLYLYSLQNLEICRCPELRSLPERLPNSLKSLVILDSAILKERCRHEQGEEWPKIRRIPKIEIDYVEILTAGL